jgi:hypothetical protein
MGLTADYSTGKQLAKTRAAILSLGCIQVKPVLIELGASTILYW